MEGKGKKQQMGRNTPGSVDIKKLKNEMIKELSDLPNLFPTCCIYEAPRRLRHGNENSYIPKVVSIGPLHHGKEELQPMELHKKRYLDFLIKKKNLSLELCIDVINQSEKDLQNCYAEAIKFSRNEFVKIILLDAAFIIAFLLKFEFRDIREEDPDRIFGKPWKIQDIWLDILLLENQLPFFILCDLFKLLGPVRSETDMVDIFDLSLTFFEQLLHLKVDKSKWATICTARPEHFVDLLRCLLLPLNKHGGNGKVGRASKMEGTNNKEGTSKVQGSSNVKGNEQGGRGRPIPPTPSITELSLAGATFKVASGENLLGLKFSKGVLEIPKLIMSEGTEILIRNLLAFEQCHCEKYRINEYVFIMNRLVNSQKDVDIMVKYEIVENRLANNERGSILMNNLIDGIKVDFDGFYFAPLCEDLNKYYRKSWDRWMVDFREKYLKTPWTVISLFAAATMLILTFIQTVNSSKSSNPNGPRP